MLIPYDKRVAPISAINPSANNNYATANPGGPAGSSLMTFFAVITMKRTITAGADVIFQRRVGAAGWMIYMNNSNQLFFYAANATPAFVATPAAIVPNGIPLILIGRYNGVPNPGNIEGWINGVSTGITTLGTGYTVAVSNTCIGCNSSSAAEAANDQLIHEVGMLDTYDAQASYNTAFGTGVAGLTAQWQEDLQQGRYLTDPTGSNWGANTAYWSARDALLGVGAPKLAWLDRSTNLYSMARTGAPQPAQAMARF
jgi:hypothetical protein